VASSGVWNRTFLPDDAERRIVRNRLRDVLEPRSVVEATEETDMLLVRAKDLLAGRRAAA